MQNTSYEIHSSLYFFFQADDGIRPPLVTGVQTCALPIYSVSGTACRCQRFSSPNCWRNLPTSSRIRPGSPVQYAYPSSTLTSPFSRLTKIFVDEYWSSAD